MGSAREIKRAANQLTAVQPIRREREYWTLSPVAKNLGCFSVRQIFLVKFGFDVKIHAGVGDTI